MSEARQYLVLYRNWEDDHSGKKTYNAHLIAYTAEDALTQFRVWHGHDEAIQVDRIEPDAVPEARTVEPARPARRVMNHIRIDWLGAALVGAIAAAALFAGCTTARPQGVWVGVGPQEAEVGVQGPFAGNLKGEASVALRDSSDGSTRSRLVPAGLAAPCRPDVGPSHEEEAGQRILGRLGLRYCPAPWVHFGGGLTEELGLYSRLGFEARLTREFSLGIDLVADRGGEALLTLGWAR